MFVGRIKIWRFSEYMNKLLVLFEYNVLHVCVPVYTLVYLYDEQKWNKM